MYTINRREFLQGSGLALAGFLLRHVPVQAAPQPLAPPASLGRVILWQQAVQQSTELKAKTVAWRRYNEIIPLRTAVEGEAPWPSNPIWYETDGGFVHSGYIQPVENQLQTEVIAEVPPPGFWVQVSVPIAEARWQPDSSYVAVRLYYGTVYRVVKAVADSEGTWWYQLQEGITYSPGPYVPSWSVRRLPPEELAPLSPDHPDKWIQVNVKEQSLTCFEGQTAVFTTAVSTGVGDHATPRGEFRVLRKRYTSRMIGGDKAQGDYYDLPGVAFPVYFTGSAVATHGTYWHNDYGRRHSHGCVNVPNETAKWLFRWTEPALPYDQAELVVKAGTGTRVVVV